MKNKTMLMIINDKPVHICRCSFCVHFDKPFICGQCRVAGECEDEEKCEFYCEIERSGVSDRIKNLFN